MTHLTAVDAPPNLLNQLAQDLELAQAKLKEAQAEVAQAKKALTEHVGVRDEGDFTVSTDLFKVKTNQSYTYKLDPELLPQELPQDIRESLIRTKYELNLRLYRDLEKYNPDRFMQAARAVTRTPRAPAVTIERIQEVAHAS